MRSFADLHDGGGQSFADVGHGGGEDVLLTQFLNDVDTRLGLQLTTQKVVLASEVGLRARVFLKDFLFTLKEQQTCVGSGKVARHTNKFVLRRAFARTEACGFALPYRGHGNHQFARRSGEVETGEVGVYCLATGHHTAQNLLHHFEVEAIGDSDVHQ